MGIEITEPKNINTNKRVYYNINCMHLFLAFCRSYNKIPQPKLHGISIEYKIFYTQQKKLATFIQRLSGTFNSDSAKNQNENLLKNIIHCRLKVRLYEVLERQ